MAKQKIGLLLLIITIVVTWWGRYLVFNQEITQMYTTPREYYEIGDTISYDDNIINTYTYHGYRIRVDSAELYRFDDFLNQFEIEEAETVRPAFICLLYVTIYNDNNVSRALELDDLTLYGGDHYLYLSDYLETINPQSSTAAYFYSHPEIGQKEMLILPYAAYLEDDSEQSILKFESQQMYLGLTHFPKELLVMIQWHRIEL